MKHRKKPIGYFDKSARTRSVILLVSCSAIAGLFAASIAMATHVVTKTEDIRNTKHYFVGNPDILGGQPGEGGVGSGTTEVCVFCHTPHGANKDVQSQAPLWNRRTPDPTSAFIPYTAPNFEGAGHETNPKPKGISLACLSCHDGTIAVDALINAPGSGGYIDDNRAIQGAPGVSSPLIGFAGPGIDANSSLKEGVRDSIETSTTPFSPFSGGLHDTVFQNPGGAPDGGMEPFPNLTQDLADDHPISMEVPADGFTSGSKRDPQFAPIGANSPPPAQSGVSIKFITRSAGILPYDLRDRIRAYPSEGAAAGYFIECASCHNPHTPRTNFLRLPSFVPGLVTQEIDPTTPISEGNFSGEPWGQYPNNGSAICLTCHAK